MTGRLAFEPELVSRPAIEGSEAGFDGFSKRFLIHEADHEHAAGNVVLNHRGDRPSSLLKSNSSFPVDTFAPIKKPAFRSAGFVDSLRNCSETRRTPMVLMVMMGVAEHERII